MLQRNSDVWEEHAAFLWNPEDRNIGASRNIDICVHDYIPSQPSVLPSLRKPEDSHLFIYLYFYILLRLERPVYRLIHGKIVM